MAIYHLSAKIISRKSGRSATAAAAYRSASVIVDKRTGEIHDYSKKRGVVHRAVVMPSASSWNPDSSDLWNAVELKNKRSDAQVAREFVVALPAELKRQSRENLVMEFAREIVNRYGIAAEVAIHAPSKEGDSRNHHAHILTTTNRIEGNGLGNKVRELDLFAHNKGGKLGQANEIDHLRERWSELQNDYLARSDLDVRVDHRTLSEQGIERQPTRHLGPAATGFERRTGRPSHRRRIEAPSTRQRRALAQQVEQQRQALSGAGTAVQVLSGALLAAQQQRAAEWATVLGLRRRANAEAAERRQREARERIEAMSSAELAAEIERLRPPDLGRLVEADPAVIEARKAAERLSGQREEAAKAKTLAEQQEGAWRLQHAYRSRLHDRGWWNSPELDEFAEAREAAHQRWLEVSPRVVEAEQRVQSERTMAEVRIREAQRPARDRVAALEALRQQKERQERAEAARQERERVEREYQAMLEARRQAEEAHRQQLQAEREQVVRAFKSLAVKRAGRSRGFRDGDEQWEATPEPLQALVDGFNAMPKPRQERVLQGLRRDLEKNLQVEVWLDERKQTIERNRDRDQDHGLSM